ncbi:MAG: glycerol-3-phosphate acyltransferase [Lachnospiraceae bacterium]|nr:glycerol-3-phosphate acyltransferase [Lachnospiraceae bacterium]
MEYAVTILLAYLVGSSSMTWYLSKLKNVNMRAGGSGNLGASNAVALMGWKAGILVGIHDIGKSILAVLVAQMVFPHIIHIGAVAGVASVLGHIFPFYLKFKGGKGFASYLGMTIALNWKLALVILLIVGLILLITDYIVIGTVTTVLTVPTYMGIVSHSWVLAAILAVATVVILYKHRENYVRIYNGTELGFRGVSRGDHRVK